MTLLGLFSFNNGDSGASKSGTWRDAVEMHGANPFSVLAATTAEAWHVSTSRKPNQSAPPPAARCNTASQEYALCIRWIQSHHAPAYLPDTIAFRCLILFLDLVLRSAGAFSDEPSASAPWHVLRRLSRASRASLLPLPSPASPATSTQSARLSTAVSVVTRLKRLDDTKIVFALSSSLALTRAAREIPSSSCLTVLVTCITVPRSLYKPSPL